MDIHSSVYNECKAYCQIINKVLHPKSRKFPSELHAYYLPVTPENLLERCRDGILLAYLLVDIAPQTRGSLAKLTPCLLHVAGSGAESPTTSTNQTVSATESPSSSIVDGSNVFVLHSNLTTVLNNMARATGIVVVNASPSDIIAMKKEQVLGVIWQIVRAHLLCHLSVRNCEELLLLMEEDESLELFVMIKPEILLTRWVNYHLARSPFQRRHPKKLRNIPKDLIDCEIYIMLMHQLFPEIISNDKMEMFFGTEHLVTRAHLTIKYFAAVSEGLPSVLEPMDIIEENSKLSVAFLCELFDLKNGLSISEADGLGEMRRDEFHRMFNLNGRSVPSSSNASLLAV